MRHDKVVELTVADGICHNVATISDPAVGVGIVHQVRNHRVGTHNSSGNSRTIRAVGGSSRFYNFVWHDSKSSLGSNTLKGRTEEIIAMISNVVLVATFHYLPSAPIIRSPL